MGQTTICLWIRHSSIAQGLVREAVEDCGHITCCPVTRQSFANCGWWVSDIWTKSVESVVSGTLEWEPLGPTFQAGKSWNLSSWFIFAFSMFMQMCYVYTCAYMSTCLCTHMCERMQMEVQSWCQQLSPITRPPWSLKQILTITHRALQCG